MQQIFKSKFLQIMRERGFINQCSNFEAMDEKLYKAEQKGESVVGYLGADPTGDSLHVGHLVPVMMMRWFQKCGHKPLMLVGGATGLIGDPKENEERPMLSLEQLEENKKGLKKSYEKFFKFGTEQTDSIMVDNYDWFKGIGFLDFLRDIGKIYSVGKLLGLDRIRKRVDSEGGISYMEFSYPLIQGYDFLHLYEKYNCEMQLCGSDQWGNSITGLEIIRKKKQAEVFVMTTPLLTDSNGKKMGKSEGNAVWINEDKLSSYDYYQYFRNVADADVIKLLKIYTEIPMEEIEKYEKLSGHELNEAKKVLAFEATKICRGEQEAISAQQTAIEAFEKGNFGGDLPTFEVNFKEKSHNLVSLLLELNQADSKKEIRRLIEQGGIKIADKKVENFDLDLSINDLIDNQIIISIGKKKKIILKQK